MSIGSGFQEGIVKTQNLKLIALFGAGILAQSSALGAITLKQVQALGSNRVELSMDAKVHANQIQTDFFNDTIQLTLKDANIYPAKILNLSNHEAVKVFAYQYAPRVVRIRLTVPKNAESYRATTQVSANARGVSITLGSAAASTKEESKESAEEAAIRDRVMSSQSAPVAQEKKIEAPAKATAEKRERLTGGSSPVPNMTGTLIKMLLVLMLLGGALMVIRRMKGGSARVSTKAANGLMGKLSKSKWLLGLKKDSLIDVVATHYLGPKKSIAVVRISGRMMVLGITDEAINLISELDAGASDADLDADVLLDHAMGRQAAPKVAKASNDQSSFSEIVQTVSSKPSSGNSVRAQIRSRLEGMKQI